MEKKLNNGFCEMTQEEAQFVEGGVDWDKVAGGASIVVTCIGAAATAPVTGLTVAALCAITAVGGYMLGNGFVS